jgi:predicted acyltransferase
MDQFRGYTVAGMFLVNFLGGFAVIHSIFKHNNTHFSYADSIMPSFMFAVGFSYRLTMLRRLPQLGWLGAFRHTLFRSMTLIAISLALTSAEWVFESENPFAGQTVRRFVAKLLKAQLWETLAIIGVSQLLIFPVVAARPWVRIATIAAFMVAHVILSWSFNYEFVNGRPNWLDPYWGAEGTRAWDGGLFGPLMWSAPMLAGTLAYDVVVSATSGSQSIIRLILWGATLMAAGWLLSCFSTLYDVNGLPGDTVVSPVLPPLEQLSSRPLASLLADPPFVAPPGPEERMANYWMMDKRVVTLTFTLFATGFAMAVYGVFVLACDRAGWKLDVFRMLGQNPLLAYILHEFTEKLVAAFLPKNAPLVVCLIGLVVFFAITLWLLRFLDRRKIYLRL